MRFNLPIHLATNMGEPAFLTHNDHVFFLYRSFVSFPEIPNSIYVGKLASDDTDDRLITS